MSKQAPRFITSSTQERCALTLADPTHPESALAEQGAWVGEGARDCPPKNAEPWGGFLPISTDWGRLRPHLKPTPSFFFLHAFWPRQQRICLQCRRLGFDPGRQPYSSIPAWGIPWAEEPGRIYSPRGRNESDRTERVTLSLSGLGALRPLGQNRQGLHCLLPTVHIRPEGGGKFEREQDLHPE